MYGYRGPEKGEIFPITKVELLSKKVAEYGCFYRKGDVLVPSKIGDFIYEMSSEEEQERQQQVKVMGEFFTKGWCELVQDPEVRDWLGISYEMVDLVIRTNPAELPWTIYFGLDLCGDPYVINDLNPDRPVLIGYQPEIAHAFEAVYPELAGQLRSFYHGLLPTAKEMVESGWRVFVLTEKDDPHFVAYDQFAKRFGFKVGSIQEFNPAGFDLVIRALKTVEILNNPDEYSGLVDSLEHGLSIINPLGSFIGGNKGWLTVLRAKGLVPDDWFPASWIVKDGKVLDHEGNIIALEEILLKFLDERKRYVVKEVFSAGGRKVNIGAELKRWQWHELWSEIVNSKVPWAIEELQPRNEVEVQVGDWSSLEDPIVTRKRKLNILQRIYAVGDFSTVYAEGFGKEGWKVNASGYSFPVSFESGGTFDDILLEKREEHSWAC